MRTQERFQAINFSDCLLMGIRTLRVPGMELDDVRLDVGMIAGPDFRHWNPSEIQFVDCVALFVEIDYWAKRCASDSISEAVCRKDPNFAATVLHADSSRLQLQSLDEFFLFELTLVSGGSVRVFARDFMLNQSL